MARRSAMIPIPIPIPMDLLPPRFFCRQGNRFFPKRQRHVSKLLCCGRTPPTPPSSVQGGGPLPGVACSGGTAAASAPHAAVLPAVPVWHPHVRGAGFLVHPKVPGSFLSQTGLFLSVASSASDTAACFFSPFCLVTFLPE